jgi:copper chaperone
MGLMKPMNQEFLVQGMTCGHCEQAVRDAITEVDPKATVVIDRASGKVQVQSDVAAQALAAAIEEEGYQVAAP